MTNLFLSISNNIFDITFLNADNFFELIIRFLFNLGISILLVRYIYYVKSRRKDYLFTYLLISTIVFLLCILLENVKLQLGFALGLFALFGIIRYRTNPIPIKEMTYLFLIIGISVINALANESISYAELLFTNIAVLGVTWALEFVFLLTHESKKTIVYEKIDLVKPENRNQLLSDLRERTGIDIHKVEVGEINFLRDTAMVTIYYIEDKNHLNLTDNESAQYNSAEDDL